MPPYNPNRLKVQLKLAVTRLKHMQQKKNSINKQQRREIATLLETSKLESAKIRVEGIIREDYHIEAMEILELYCELLMARFGLIEQMKQCDPSIIEAVNTLIYAAPRSEIKELGQIRDQLCGKYGKEFAMNASENKSNCVSERVIQKLSFNTPDSFLVNRYLEEIAKTYNVDWKAEIADIDGLLSMDALMDSQALTNKNGKSEPTYTALPNMDLLMSLNNDTQDKNNQSASTSTSNPSDHLLPDGPNTKNKLGVAPSPILHPRQQKLMVYQMMMNWQKGLKL
ncbi:1804_t:CDS:2 [Funneliformis geosporum]|uniref:16459_t:CDS:1 n=1 Tax=Funneliformis geosporum TaxID=1117311 RepID=A0A9W4SDT1_9GLOM|nr:1804_t:CDS:2 [Funneliformis geosporum]CAI2165639.1 16459_t:CDS:2 [Funneliformis geosporum]